MSRWRSGLVAFMLAVSNGVSLLCFAWGRQDPQILRARSALEFLLLPKGLQDTLEPQLSLVDVSVHLREFRLVLVQRRPTNTHRVCAAQVVRVLQLYVPERVGATANVYTQGHSDERLMKEINNRVSRACLPRTRKLDLRSLTSRMPSIKGSGGRPQRPRGTTQRHQKERGTATLPNRARWNVAPSKRGRGGEATHSHKVEGKNATRS